MSTILLDSRAGHFSWPLDLGKNRAGDLKLASPNKHVHDVLRRTNLDTVFKVYGTDDEAIAAFQKQVA